MARPPSSLPPTTSDPVRVELLLGSFTHAPAKLTLFDLTLPPSLPPPTHPDEASFHPLPEIVHTFRPEPRLPPHVVAAHARAHPLVFTHGDLMPRNVLVRGTAVAALLDWDAAGWFPAHWEYRQARWTASGPLAASWTPRIPRFVPAYPVEADADDYLSRMFWNPS